MFSTRSQRNYFRRRLTVCSESSDRTSSSETENEEIRRLSPNRNASNDGFYDTSPERRDQDMGSTSDDCTSIGHFPNMTNSMISNDKLSRLRCAYKNLGKADEQYQHYLKQSKHLVRDIKDSADTVENEVNEHFKSTSASLEAEKKRLLQEVRETRNARVAKVEDDQARAKETAKTLKSLQNRLKMNTREVDYEAKLNGIFVQSEAIANNLPPVINHDLTWMQFQKDDSVRNKGLGQINMIKADRKLHLQLETEFGRGLLLKLSKARGIAVTKKGLIAVAESNASKVGVWEEANGEYQRKYDLKMPENIQGLNKPTDVAVITGDRFIVIDSSNTVKVFSACGEYDHNEWIKEEGTTCVTSELNEDGFVIIDVTKTVKMFCSSGGDPEERIKNGGTTCVTSDPKLGGSVCFLMDSGNKIVRFNKDGHILRPIVAGTPSHATTTDGENLAISNLKEVKIFAFDSGKELLDFEASIRGLCFDAVTKSILATTCNRQIAQFCSKTGQLLDIISEDILNDPWGLVIIPGRRLAVADDQSVKIYKIIDL